MYNHIIGKEVDEKSDKAKDLGNGVINVLGFYAEKLGYDPNSYSHKEMVKSFSPKLLQKIIEIAMIKIGIISTQTESVSGDGTGGIDSVHHYDSYEMTPQPLIGIILAASLTITRCIRRDGFYDGPYYIGHIKLDDSVLRAIIKNLATILYFNEKKLGKEIYKWTEEY